MLSAEDLESMRRTAMEILVETARVLRATRQADGMGGFVESWSPSPPIPCRVIPSAAHEEKTADQIHHVASCTILLPPGVDVRAGDRIEVGGRAFEVVGVPPRHAYEVLTEIHARVVDDGGA